MDDDVAVCIHCHNRVEKIEYVENKRVLMPGTLYNEFRHRKGPRMYPVCGVSPLMGEDVEWVHEEDL